MKLPFASNEIKLKQSEKLLMIESLSIMLSAGIPILEALDSIAEDTSNKSSKTLAQSIAQDINKGRTLSQSMATHPLTFDSVFLNIIKSGEESGNLDKVLSQLAKNLKANIETVNNIRSALFYPALVVLVLAGVTIYMFAFALPKIAEVFTQLRLSLPAYSQFILDSSLFFSDNLTVFMGILLFFVVLAAWLFTKPAIRKVFFQILIKIPLFKSLIGYIDLSRFTGTSALLLQAGVPIIEVFNIAKNVVIAPRLKEDIDLVRHSITQGSSLIDAMKKHPKSFPSLLSRLVGVGEETGNLDKSLAEISLHYEKKYTDIVKNLTVLLEPILIVFIAVLVGAVLISVIVPIYQGIGQFGPRQGL